MKLRDRQRWIEVSYSGDNRHCPTVNSIVNGATQRAIKRLRHMGIGSGTIGCVCPLCSTQDHYCYLSEDRHSVTCSLPASKTGKVTDNISCWFEGNYIDIVSNIVLQVVSIATVTPSRGPQADTQANHDGTLHILGELIKNRKV